MKTIVRILSVLGVLLTLPGFSAPLHGQTGEKIKADSALPKYRPPDIDSHQVTRHAITRALLTAARLRSAGPSAALLSEINAVAFFYGELSEPDSALAYYREGLSIARMLADQRSEAITLSYIAGIQNTLGRPDSALIYFRRALPMQRGVRDRAGEAETLNGIGNVYDYIGRPDSALSYYRNALVLWRERGDRSGEAMTVSNIGSVFSQLGRADSALYYFKHALRINREERERAGEAASLNNIGGAYNKLGLADSALVYYQQALPIVRMVGYRLGEATTLSNIGSVFTDLGRPDSALVYYHQALPIRRAIGDLEGEAATLNNIGVYYSVLDADSAVAYYRQALATWRAAGNRSGELTTLNNIAQKLRNIGTPFSLVEASAAFDSAAALATTLHGFAGSDADRLVRAEQDNDLFEEWTLTWLALAPAVGSNHATWAALAATELGRAQALSALRRAASGAFGRSSETQPGADLPAKAKALAQAALSDRSAALVYQLAADTLLTWLLVPGGEARLFRAPLPDSSVASAVAALRVAITGGDSAAARMTEIEGRPSVMTGAATSRMTLQAAAAALAAMLLPSEFEQLIPAGTELVIVADGVLFQVPFAALPLNGSAELLADRHALRYAPSLELAGAQHKAKRNASSGGGATAFVVGNPLMPLVTRKDGSRVQLTQLHGAENESNAVATRLHTNALKGTHATESAVRAALPRADIVHLATHGYAYSSEARARDSFVAFAADATHDGLLTVGEVLDDLPALKAELVVLSACQTGLGDLKQAEGTVGLQRAFLAKGARSVLVSLWSVSDAATETLMTSFYAHWLEDVDKPAKSEALQRAQNDVRSIPAFEHPRYWSAFQLVGGR